MSSIIFSDTTSIAVDSTGQLTIPVKYQSQAIAAGCTISTFPPSQQTQFGNSGATGAPTIASFAEEGNVYRQITPAGVTSGVTGADVVMMVYSLPAGSFDQANRGLTITASGACASNANAKRVKLIYNPTTPTIGATVSGGTTIADTGSVTSTSGQGWNVQASVFKYGAAGSNTQEIIHNAAQMGAVIGPLISPTGVTAVESGAITIALTCNNVAVGDLLPNWLEVNAMN
jgi:hypothetical protein